VCDWLVAVKVRGTLVVSVTCKNKLKTQWKTQDKATKKSNNNNENNNNYNNNN